MLSGLLYVALLLAAIPHSVCCSAQRGKHHVIEDWHLRWLHCWLVALGKSAGQSACVGLSEG
jgi:hypothetical protein